MERSKAGGTSSATRQRPPAGVSRRATAFGALVLAQAAHSVEEYRGRLWDAFPPARFVSGLISADLERGFLLANLCLVAFGVWCWLWPVRRGWRGAAALAWVWVGIEIINGIGHPLWSLRQSAYTPGVATAPILLVLAIVLAGRLNRREVGAGGATGPRSSCRAAP